MIEIHSDNSVSINGEITKFKVIQKKSGTVVYSVVGGQYKEHKMPVDRYSLAHTQPASGVAGRDEFEIDLVKLLQNSQ